MRILNPCAQYDAQAYAGSFAMLDMAVHLARVHHLTIVELIVLIRELDPGVNRN